MMSSEQPAPIAEISPAQAQEVIAQAMRDKYGKDIAAIDMYLDSDVIMGERVLALTRFEGINESFIVSYDVVTGEINDTFALINASDDFEERVIALMGAWPNASADVSMAVVGSRFMGVYGDKVDLFELMKNETLLITARLLIPSREAPDMSEEGKKLADLGKSLAENGLDAHFACEYVTDIDAALDVIKMGGDIETALFDRGIMLAYTSFDIRNGVLRQDDKGIENGFVSGERRINDFISVRAYNRYGDRMELMDDDLQEELFAPYDVVGGILNFTASPEGRVTIDLTKLSVDVEEVDVVGVVWDLDQLEYNVVSLDFIEVGDNRVEFDIPAGAFAVVRITQ